MKNVKYFIWAFHCSTIISIVLTGSPIALMIGAIVLWIFVLMNSIILITAIVPANIREQMSVSDIELTPYLWVSLTLLAAMAALLAYHGYVISSSLAIQCLIPWLLAMGLGNQKIKT